METFFLDTYSFGEFSFLGCQNHTELCKKNCHFEAQDIKSDQISILTKTRYVRSLVPCMLAIIIACVI